ncbi:polynucleotide adenylyltransferase PcnB [Litorivicinus lipolyticus]|uniref:polynucleotide adenylyltransferase PcnB n=1 Tax=Litorivicinus lipolyticus TaxID=418701 RepID=UPI001FEB1DB8|nr:polynucleotide adenylyltransferase PcnB [Litorivicinus lipolyticus]
MPPSVHGIEEHRLNSGAISIMEQLNTAGYDAYLVGGGVRDFLLGKIPKDFDIATNATPEQVTDIFRRARIVGRRFQIVHVRVGPEVFEVTTFRAGHEGHKGSDAIQNEAGMLTRDNIWGSVEEDAKRRDFTLNALYYNHKDRSVYDFVGAWEDVKAKRLRIIGDPETRYREDPVRMLRAIRFMGKLPLTIDEKTELPIIDHGHLLSEVSSSRLFDEVLKLLQAGHGADTFELLWEFGLFQTMFPEASAILEAQQDSTYWDLIEQALENTDARIQSGRTVNPAFLYACLLWPAAHQRFKQYLQSGMEPTEAMAKAGAITVDANATTVAIPRRFAQVTREIWEMQLRLPNTQTRRALSLLRNPRFRAAYDFLLLREQSQEIDPGLGRWWTDFQVENPDVKPEREIHTREERPRKRRRQYRK